MINLRPDELAEPDYEEMIEPLTEEIPAEQSEEMLSLMALAEEGGRDLLTDEEAAMLGEVEPQQEPDSHDSNLAEYLDDSQLGAIAQKIVQWVEWDDKSRDDWKKREARGIKLLGVSDSLNEGASFKGASRVVHPILMEACIQYQARAISELWPQAGPAKVEILGTPTPESIEQSRRVEQFINYQYLRDMPGAFTEEDKLLFRQPLSGSCFIKIYVDALTGKPTRRFVDPNDFIVPYRATDLASAPRYTHVIYESHNDVLKKMESGHYKKTDLLRPYAFQGDQGATQDVRDEIDKAEGRSNDTPNDETQHCFYEMHVEYDLPGFAHVGRDGKDSGIGLPYVITVERDSQKVVSIYRNWEEQDEQQKKLLWFVHRPFLQGLGFYGYGYLHAIGSLADAATGALRAVLDSAAFSNMQGGFRSRDAKLPAGDVEIGPGEWLEVESTVEDLKKAFFAIPYKEPSNTLVMLLGKLDDLGRRFAFTADATVGEGSNTGPVGTTVALIEQGLKVYSSIHKRQFDGWNDELKIVARLNRDVLPAEYPYNVSGQDATIYKADFDDRVDVLPVSNPSASSTMQRVATAQTVMDLAERAPQLYDQRAVHKRMLDALRVENTDELMPDQNQPPAHQDPVTENAALLTGGRVKSYPDQDHQAHMIVHQSWFEMLDPETQKAMQGPHSAHMGEHRAMDYVLLMQQQMGMQQHPAMQQLAGGEPQQIPPEIENRLAVMAAQSAQFMRQQQELAQQAAQQQEQAANDKQIQADIARKDAIARSDINRKDAVAMADVHRKAVTG